MNFKFKKNILFCLILLSITSCSGIQILDQKNVENSYNPKDSEIEVLKNLSTKRKAKIQYKKKSNTNRRRHKYTFISKNNDVLLLNAKEKRIKFWLRYYNKSNNKERLIRQIKRGFIYKNVVENIFISHGIPKELFYVGLIESGYSLGARSHAKAVGPWQFMKGTGKQYHLKVNWYLDERRNLIKSTQASANYFKDLYNIFGSWELALCAYNAGEYRIIRAIRKGNSRNYNELINKGLLPKETVSYIPKVIAAIQMTKQLLKKIRFKKQFDLKDYKFVKMRGVRSLKNLSHRLKMDYQLLQKLNPEYQYKVLPVRKLLSFLVPKKIKNNHFVTIFYSSRHDKQYRSKKRSHKRRRSISSFKMKHSKRYTYTVKAGDNLYAIRRLFKISNKNLMKLKKINKIKRNIIYKGQKLIIPSLKIVFYKVRSGDNLLKIALKYKVSIKFLKNINRLSGEKILSGQLLKIPRV